MSWLPVLERAFGVLGNPKRATTYLEIMSHSSLPIRLHVMTLPQGELPPPWPRSNRCKFWQPVTPGTQTSRDWIGCTSAWYLDPEARPDSWTPVPNFLISPSASSSRERCSAHQCICKARCPWWSSELTEIQWSVQLPNDPSWGFPVLVSMAQAHAAVNQNLRWSESSRAATSCYSPWLL